MRLHSRYSRQILASLLFLSVSFSLSSAAHINHREYQIKTAFMLNFFKFTQWQQPKEHPNFIFCSSNENYTKIASTRLKLKSVRGKSIKLITVLPNQEHDCDALFVTKYENKQWSEHLTSHQHSNLLIIGELSGFARYTGHIKLFRINNKLRFQVNVASLKQDKLKMSPQLLRLASIYADDHTSNDMKNGVAQ